MQPQAKVILDSVSPDGVRLCTLEVVMHRFVLAEFNTHRVFSRNSASSRAIPVDKQLERVQYDPAFPLEWASEQPGMQGGSELTGEDLDDALALWNNVLASTLTQVQMYLKSHPDKSTRLHKSLINRLIEPWMWHTVIVTATEYDNFFGLRCSSMAQPEIRVPAEQMQEVMASSKPQFLDYGKWHMPYVQEDEFEQHGTITLRQLSAARCARVSYLTHDGVRDIDKDLELYKRLTSAAPPHASPLEHVATPLRIALMSKPARGNFYGWMQLRHYVGAAE